MSEIGDIVIFNPEFIGRSQVYFSHEAIVVHSFLKHGRRILGAYKGFDPDTQNFADHDNFISICLRDRYLLTIRKATLKDLSFTNKEELKLHHRPCIREIHSFLGKKSL